MFIAPTIDGVSCSNAQWPRFWLLRCDYERVEECYPSWLLQFTSDMGGTNIIRLFASKQLCNPTHSTSNGNFSVNELDFSTDDYTFETGDLLGVSYPPVCRDQGCQRLNILYQNGGGYCDANVIRFYPASYQLQPILPYIALETGET